ncbi:hypothetical protein GDO78_015648 [Eleutherodactylus coqui]|uniref:Uncharacterized protein n=1 Tax=Eleutherodactylus coqui TaxID=57060 RepID=A0A8J6BET2_ELECQ|nr:hypothetical protein GDO78_015648 [Eleutherodactylus coqui]
MSKRGEKVKHRSVSSISPPTTDPLKQSQNCCYFMLIFTPSDQKAVRTPKWYLRKHQLTPPPPVTGYKVMASEQPGDEDNVVTGWLARTFTRPQTPVSGPSHRPLHPHITTTD